MITKCDNKKTPQQGRSSEEKLLEVLREDRSGKRKSKKLGLNPRSNRGPLAVEITQSKNHTTRPLRLQ